MAEQEHKVHFRGGVRYLPDEGKWRIIIELNGASYLDESQYDTEEEAMVVYREARKLIAKQAFGATGPDLEFSTKMGCALCEQTFQSWVAYDSHLPCAGKPPE